MAPEPAMAPGPMAPEPVLEAGAPGLALESFNESPFETATDPAAPEDQLTLF
jgi:hypothetical protein